MTFLKVMFLVFSVHVLCISSSLAGSSKGFITSQSTQNVFRQDERNLTPEDRIRQSELKVQQNPSLRSRWTPKSRQPASEVTYPSDNLTEKILSDFREDEIISKIPAKLKVSSTRGVVTLDGVVNNDNERSLIEKKVGQTEGVKKVVNHLKVKTVDQDLLD